MKGDRPSRKGRTGSPPDEITSLGSNIVEADQAPGRKRQRTGEGAKSAGPKSGWDVGGREGVDAPAVPSTSGQSGLQRGLPASRASPSEKDKDGHLLYELGQSITPRYKILSKLGEGTFGRVLECWDREKKQYVAIKVIRNVPKYREAAYIEIEILQRVAKQDVQGKRHCVQLAHFEYKGHVCMVFERLGMSLYDFLRRNHYRPFKIDLVRDFTRQMLKSVEFLHKMKLTHTDLKPENILLVSNDYTSEPAAAGSSANRVPVSSKIKLIDFGNATFHDQYHCSVVSTRHYRAPEVILGLGWTYPCDVWSVGCILLELLTGEALFQTHDNLEHLAMMEVVLGPIPASMIMQADRSAAKYFRGDALSWPPADGSRDSISAVRRMLSLPEIAAKVDRSEVGRQLTDLLKGILKYDPKERMKASEALGHGFFQGGDRRNTSDGSVGGHDGGGGGRDSVDGGHGGGVEAEGVSSRGASERST